MTASHIEMDHLDQIAASNVRWLTTKEIFVGALNGVVWALVVALVAYLWFHSIGIAVVIPLLYFLFRRHGSWGKCFRSGAK